MTGGVTVGVAHAGGAMVGGVEMQIGSLTGTDPPLLGQPWQVQAAPWHCDVGAIKS